GTPSDPGTRRRHPGPAGCRRTATPGPAVGSMGWRRPARRCRSRLLHSSSGLTPLYSRCCHARSALGTTPTLEVRAGRVNDMTLNAYRRVVLGMSHLQVHVELPAAILLMAGIHPSDDPPEEEKSSGSTRSRKSRNSATRWSASSWLI